MVPRVVRASAEKLLPLGTAEAALVALLGRPGSARVGGLSGAALAYVAAAAALRGRAVLVVVTDAHAHDDLLLDLDALLPGAGFAFPAWPREAGSTPPDVETLSARTQLLARLRSARGATSGTAARGAASEPLVAVASLAALLQPVPAPHVIDAAALALARGMSRPLPVLLEHLALCGYVRVAAVEAPGEFAARGGLLDVWPLGRPGPVRLDFLGDEIESLREMDPTTQRSGLAREAVELLVLPPERVRTPHESGGASPLSAHLPPGAQVVLAGPEALADEAARLGAGAGGEGRQALARLQEALHAHPVLEAVPEPLLGAGELDLEVGGADAIRAVAALRPDSLERAALEPQTQRTQRIVEGFRTLARRAPRLVIYRRAPGEEERLKELFREHAPGAAVSWREGALSRSFVFGPTGTAHVAYDDLTDLPVRERRRGARGPRQRPLADVLELEPNLPVVHLHHGIGLFRGLLMLDGPDGPGEFLRLDFAEGTIVYVPVARIDLVQRYVGTGVRPRLSKLGGTDWASRKQSVEAAVEEVAEELLALQASRTRRHAAPLPPDGPWQREFEAAFPHALTPDQESAVRAVKADLESGRPMDRLLCGDVGYGKTEVALRAMFKVVAAGRQAAVLVPTKVLCEQHVRVFAR